MILQFMNFMNHLEKDYQKIVNELSEEFRLKPVQIDILLFLANNPEYKTAQAIVGVRKIAKSHASLAIKELCDQGYLEKVINPNNKKENLLMILEKSNTVIKNGQNRQKDFFEKVFKGLNSNQLTQLNRSISIMTSNLNKGDRNE